MPKLRPRLTQAQRFRAALLRGLGLKPREIADRLAVSEQTVRTALAGFDEAMLVKVGREILLEAVPELATAAVQGAVARARKGQPDASVGILERLQVIPPAPESERPSVTVGLVLGGPAPGILSPVESLAIPALSPAPTEALLRFRPETQGE